MRPHLSPPLITTNLRFKSLSYIMYCFVLRILQRKNYLPIEIFIVSKSLDVFKCFLFSYNSVLVFKWWRNRRESGKGGRCGQTATKAPDTRCHKSNTVISRFLFAGHYKVYCHEYRKDRNFFFSEVCQILLPFHILIFLA